MGKNVRIAIAVAASRGRAVDEQALMIAIRLRMPRCIFTKAESDTTMALSTNIPIAMMIAARDIRCKAIPLANMTIKVAKIEKTNPLPIKRPFLKPIKNNKICYYGHDGDDQVQDKSLVGHGGLISLVVYGGELKTLGHGLRK